VYRVIWFGGPDGPIGRFIKKTLKRRSDEQELVMSALRILERAPTEPIPQNRFSKARGEIWEYRINTRCHWIRMLIARDGTTFLVLHAIIKKSNRLDNADIELAERRLAEARKH
jgi:phage-related protein